MGDQVIITEDEPKVVEKETIIVKEPVKTERVVEKTVTTKTTED